MKTATFQFKCRRCGVVFRGSSTNEAHAHMYLIEAELGMHTAALAPMLTDAHRCENLTGMGVGDLIGFTVEGEA